MSTNSFSGVTVEPLSASGRSSERLSLPALQSKMKCDPEGYVSELVLIYNQFKSSLELFEQQAALNFTSISGIGSDPTVAKDLSDRAMFLAHVTPFYSEQLSEFPKNLADLLGAASHSLPSGLRSHLTQALILLINKKIVDIEETLLLFMELQTLGDRQLRKLAFFHVIHSIRRMNKKHRNETKNRALQNILFGMLKQEDESKAKRALVVLCELHRRKVWFDERTANAICSASFHPSSKIMIATISFLLDYEKIENGDESDDSSSEDEPIHQSPQVIVSKESIYKAHHKGTAASKRKKQAKLQRVMRNLKRQQRRSSENGNASYYSPLNHLKDAQGFAEKLFSRLQACNERFEVRMMMLKVVARTVGLHRLILMNFYPYIRKYVQPHQRDVTDLLAAAVQTCHDMVPPDAVEPLFKQIVNQFVHDRSRPESIAVGLNVIREICMRMPLLMTEDLLQDLALYKKSHEKAVSIAARSLITLFREVCPSLLVKKDRGRPTDPKARPKAYGEVIIASNVPDIELLQNDDNDDQDEGNDNSDISMFSSSGEDDQDDKQLADGGCDEDSQLGSDSKYTDDDDDDVEVSEEDDEEQYTYDGNVDASDDDEDGGEDSNTDEDVEDDKMVGVEVEDGANPDYSPDSVEDELAHANSETEDSSTRKRKFSNINEKHISADTSLRALKKIATAAFGHPQSESMDGILSNEDFEKIKELKAKKEVNAALTQHGLLKSTKIKIPTADQLRVKPVDPAKLEIHVRPKLSKEERLALVRAGREEKGKYQARTAVKQKKTGGLSNRQKQGKKKMPLAAQRHKAAKSRQEKRKKQQRSGKQFRGKKAWK